MKTLLTLLLLTGSVFAAHRATLHMAESKGLLMAYCIVWDGTTSHHMTFNWTHSETGKKVSYTTRRKFSGRRAWVRHGVTPTVGTWTVILTDKDAPNKELARSTYIVLPKELPVSSTVL